jgi:hypothetical protein
LKPIHENGEIIYTIEGQSPPGELWIFGIRKIYTEQMRAQGTLVRLVQLIKIVSPGLILAKNIFRGLKRPLCDGDDMHGDRNKLIYTWKPIYDYDWEERHRFHSDQIKQRAAPAGKVFVVTATPNPDKTLYPTVDCWLNRWNWVDESLTLSEAPIDYTTRYAEQLK